MSAARRFLLVTMLMTCAVLALTASAARAQMGQDPTPHALAPSTDETTPPAVLSVSYEPASWGMQLQFGMSLATYRWVEMAMGQIGFRQPAVGMAPRSVARLVWWRKQS